MPEPQEEPIPVSQMTLKQRKIMLAQNELAPTIIELMKDCIGQQPLVAESEWATIVNAITMEVKGKMIVEMIEHLEAIKQGSLHEL